MIDPLFLWFCLSFNWCLFISNKMFVCLRVKRRSIKMLICIWEIKKNNNNTILLLRLIKLINETVIYVYSFRWLENKYWNQHRVRSWMHSFQFNRIQHVKNRHIYYGYRLLWFDINGFENWIFHIFYIAKNNNFTSNIRQLVNLCWNCLGKRRENKRITIG